MINLAKIKYPLVLGALICTSYPFSGTMAQNSRFYTMTDLVVLESEKNTDEFFKHYLDIRPSERQKQWREITQNIGVIWIERLISDKKFDRETFNLVEERSKTYPFLDDELFQFTKRKYLTPYFKKCFDQLNPTEKKCTDDLDRTLLTTLLESEWSYGILTAHLNKLTPAQVKKLNTVILQSPDALIFCGKKDYFQVLLRQYIEDKLSENLVLKNQNLSLISRACRLKIKNYQSEALNNSPSYKRLDSFLFLEELGNITEKERELFYISYILDNAEIGDTLNLAWNFVQSLSENYKKRENLLKEIKSLPTLPGLGVFKNPNYERNAAIIELFNKNFPEYIDTYATNCLKLLNGDKLDNKVSACHEFFSYRKLDQKWKNGYLKLKSSVEGTKL